MPCSRLDSRVPKRWRLRAWMYPESLSTMSFPSIPKRGRARSLNWLRRLKDRGNGGHRIRAPYEAGTRENVTLSTSWRLPTFLGRGPDRCSADDVGPDS